MLKKLLTALFISTCSIAYCQSWNLVGNLGTNPNSNFIGTIDLSPVVIKTNNVERYRISEFGRILFSNSYNNIFFSAGNDTSTGTNNTAIGFTSLASNTSGSHNVALGSSSLNLNTTGFYNIAIGVNALTYNKTGSSNVAIGHNALPNRGQQNDFNTAVGMSSMSRYNSVDSDLIVGNSALGQSSLAYLKNGNNNTSIGRAAVINLTSGSNNVFIGAYSGSNVTTGSNNIFIGNNTVATSADANNELNIGGWIFGKSGIIGIGTSNLSCTSCTGYKLFVKDGIRTEKVKVDIASATVLS